MGFVEPVKLGRSGLNVGRLGIASSFGAPTEAFEEAFERGCNYFTWGTFIFALSNPAVDVCMMGARDRQQMAQNLAALDPGPLDADEMARMRRIGDHVYGRKRVAS